MARVKGAMMTRKRRNRVLKAAKGYYGSKSKHFKMAKRDFRALWITRISAGAQANGLNYSKFMCGLKKAGIDLNRKMLSEIAIYDKEGFAELVEKAKAAL